MSYLSEWSEGKGSRDQSAEPKGKPRWEDAVWPVGSLAGAAGFAAGGVGEWFGGAPYSGNRFDFRRESVRGHRKNPQRSAIKAVAWQWTSCGFFCPVDFSRILDPRMSVGFHIPKQRVNLAIAWKNKGMVKCFDFE